jgi:hypothetical protein
LTSSRNVCSSVVCLQAFAPHASSTGTAFATAGAAVVAHAATAAATASPGHLNLRVCISATYPAGMAKHHDRSSFVARHPAADGDQALAIDQPEMFRTPLGDSKRAWLSRKMELIGHYSNRID